MNQLPAAWAELMGRHRWEWFVTLTFKESKHPEAADKVFRYWCKKLDESLLGSRQALRRTPLGGCVWVRGLEWQRRDVIHFHALMRWVGELDKKAGRFVWSRRWLEYSGGFGQVLPVRSQEEARRYVAKYVTKGGEVDVSPNFERTHAQHGVEWPKGASVAIARGEVAT